MARNLVIYFSRKGKNYVNGDIVELEKGNTELVAEYIRDAVGADLFEIETIKEYPDDYMECTEVAKSSRHKRIRQCRDRRSVLVGHISMCCIRPAREAAFQRQACVSGYDSRGKRRSEQQERS